VPDATGLELIAQQLRDHDEGLVAQTTFFRDQATLTVEAARIRDTLDHLREQGYGCLASLHGVDYFPDEPRLGVHYQLLDMERVDRLGVKLRVSVDAPEVPSVVDLFPTAEYQEREVFDMFGVDFAGHPDLRRILMPEDYEGFPQRRDFPLGGEAVLFTHNENRSPRWWA